MSALADIIAAVQRAVRLTPGLSESLVPDYVPDMMAADPSVFVYAGQGSYRSGGMAPSGNLVRWGVHTIVIRLHVFRKDSVSAQKRGGPFAESVPLRLFEAFDTDRFEGTVEALGDYRNAGAIDPITYLFRPDSVAEAPTLVWTFNLTVSSSQEAAPP